ncbi:MAG: cytochrome-c peroxidase, partial [Aquificae bacterium]|nr:cytochrome-c peroxidase [Aquificota bacterium]
IVEPYWHYTGSVQIDEGRYSLTGNMEDRFVFKVPSLRNVEKTFPYFHDGSVKSLKEAIRIMGKVQLGINLSIDEINSIEAFLKSLTGEIPDKTRTVPVMP